jgi:DNA-binding IclR family transcriptional regulator
MSFSEISQLVSLTQPNLERILYSLKKIGYLVQTEDEKYKMAQKFFDLSANTVPYQYLSTLARPMFSRLLTEFGESVHISVLENGLLLCMAVAESQHAHRCAAEVGQCDYAHSTAMGKCILAYRSPEEVDAVIEQRGLPRLTPATIVDKQELLRQLEIVRAKGYAINHGEATEGVSCVAAPIFNNEGKVIAALSVSGPSFRMQTLLENLPKGVLRETKRLSLLLGYRAVAMSEAMVMT